LHECCSPTPGNRLPWLFVDDDHGVAVVMGVVPMVMMFPMLLVDFYRRDGLSLDRRNKNTQGKREQQ